MRPNGQSYSNSNNVRTPAEIERQIELTRARMTNTIEAIRKDLSPGQLVDHALHYFKDGKVSEAAGNMASSVATSVGGVVKANPLPAAVVGAGLTWLIVSNYKTKHPTVELPRSMDMSDATLPGVDTTGEAWSTSSTLAEGLEHHRFEGAKERLGDMKEGVKARGAAVKENVKARSVAVKERAQHMSHSAAERARATGVKAQQTARRAKESSVRGYEAQPLIVGAIAVGIGALLGSLLPRTARENQLLGKKRDDLMAKADEMGANVLGKAKEKVDSGVQMVKEKLERSSGIVQGEQASFGQQQQQEQLGSMGVPSTTFESELAPTTGGVSGQSAYGASTVDAYGVVQAAPLAIPEEIFSGSPIGSEGGISSDSAAREIEGAEPSSFPPKGRGPGI